MQLVHLILPSLATLALGSALLAPHREDRAKSRLAVLESTPAESEPAAAEFANLVTASEAGAPAVEAASPESAESGPVASETPDAAREPDPPSQATAGESDRFVPLTRRRLRRRTAAVAWPALVDGPKSDCGPEERARLLGSLDAPAFAALRERVLLQAVAEEQGQLRLLALRSLARSPWPEAAGTLEEILVNGCDEERALAIEGLLALGRRETLAAAFGDRIDAIVAKAVLGYVGTRRRADYAEIFEHLLDPSQREAVRTLLAGALD